MKAVLRPALISFAILGLAACASGSGTARIAPAEPAPGTVVQNSAYIDYVERTARRRGIEVQWVNPPTRRIASN